MDPLKGNMGRVGLSGLEKEKVKPGGILCGDCVFYTVLKQQENRVLLGF